MKVHSLTVALEADCTQEELEALIEKIQLTSCVLNVTEHYENTESHMAMERARREMGKRLIVALGKPGDP